MTLNQKPGNIWVEISADGKTAWLNKKKGDILKEGTVLRDLEEAGVVKGINRENLLKACKGERLQKSEHIADYIPAGIGKDAYVRHLILHEIKPKLREDGTIDFREINLIRNVRENEPLLTKIPPMVGTEGFLVTGEKIPGKKGADFTLKKYCGSGTKISEKNENLLIAARPGAYKEFSNGKISVLDVFRVKGNVDYSTGNIHSTSSVMIGGDVKSGFSVESGGDVSVGGLIENASVNIDGDLTVKLGITLGFAPISVGGELKAMYIYNRPAVHAGEIIVLEMVSNSKMLVDGGVTAKRIVGGNLIAKGDILLQSAGSERHEAKTIITAGLDLKKRERRNSLIALVDEKKKMKNDLKKKIDELNRWALNFKKKAEKKSHDLHKLNNSEFGKRMKKEMQSRLQKLADLQLELEHVTQFIDVTKADTIKLSEELANPGATVTISGTVFANVSIVIGESSPMELTKSLKRVVFKLDKDGNITLNPL